MYVKGIRGYAVLAASFFVVCVALSIRFAEAQTNSVTSPDKALSEQQKQLARQFGLDPNAGGLDLVLQRLSGGCETNPYPELMSRYSLPRDALTGQPMKLMPKAGANGTGSEGINPALACRLLKLFQALEKEQGCLIKISSAYRTNGEQKQACGAGRKGCLGAGKSCHNYGLAVDIQGSCVARLRAFLGQKNPSTPGAQRFALHFPYEGDHLQCIEDRVANCSSGNGCGGGFAINPDTSGFPTSGGVPTQSYANQIRQWLNPQPQPPPLPPIAMQPLPINNPVSNAFTNPDAPITPVIDYTPASTTGKSTADILADLARGDQATSTKTGTTVPLTIDGSDVGGITSNRAQSEIVTTSGIGGTITQNTFVTDDFAWGGTELTGFRKTLDDIERALLFMSAYLKPFGRPAISGPLE